VLRYFRNDPVGLPGLAVLMLGFVVFIAALMVARMRASKDAAAPIAQKASVTWWWIVVQGIGIGIIGFGPVRVELDWGSTRAIVEAAVVALAMGGAIALFNASSRAMGKNWALVARTRTDHTLVQTGPFAHVRHPIYVALFLYTLAMAIAFGHARNLLIGLPLYLLGTAMRVTHEERLLCTQFGAAYEDYAARVKRFVPGVL
jgi:protein-S-isoprenylcysteine O-methyltransferase Ste14